MVFGENLFEVRMQNLWDNLRRGEQTETAASVGGGADGLTGEKIVRASSGESQEGLSGAISILRARALPWSGQASNRKRNSVRST
jgi:hypothetical protein